MASQVLREVPPTQEQLQQAEDFIRGYGPLPTGWRFIVLESSSKQLQFVHRDGRSTLTENHPRHTLEEGQDLNMSQQPVQAHPNGALRSDYGKMQPERFHDDTFRWQGADTMIDALVGSILTFASATDHNVSRAPHCASPERLRERFHSRLSNAQLPASMYQPSDRHRTPKSEEAAAAWFAESLGLSLVMVHTDVTDVRDYFSFEAPTRCITTRYSMGREADLFPPLYVGYDVNTWFEVVPYNTVWYDRFSVARNNWQNLYLLMRHDYDLQLTYLGFVKLAVRLQRLHRLGMSVHHAAWEALILRYTHGMMRGDEERTDINVLDRCLDSLQLAEAPFLCFDNITAAIECGNEPAAREEARILDAAIASHFSKGKEDGTMAAHAMFRALPDLKSHTLEENPSFKAPPAGNGTFQKWLAMVRPADKNSAASEHKVGTGGARRAEETGESAEGTTGSWFAAETHPATPDRVSNAAVSVDESSDAGSVDDTTHCPNAAEQPEPQTTPRESPPQIESGPEIVSTEKPAPNAPGPQAAPTVKARQRILPIMKRTPAESATSAALAVIEDAPEARVPAVPTDSPSSDPSGRIVTMQDDLSTFVDINHDYHCGLHQLILKQMETNRALARQNELLQRDVDSFKGNSTVVKGDGDA